MAVLLDFMEPAGCPHPYLSCGKTLSVQTILRRFLGFDTFVMTGKFLIYSVMLLCIFSQSLAQVSGNLEWQDAETFLQQGTLAARGTIFIEVKRVPSLTGEYRIDESGSVELPLIGNVKALEQTPTSFARFLEVLYEKDYLQNPKISVKVTDGSTPSKTIERSFDPAIANQINNLSNNALEVAAPEEVTVEPVISLKLSASDIDILSSNAPVNELTSDIDIQGIAEPSLDDLVDIKTDPQPIIIETSSSLEGTHWSLGSDAREVIHFLSEGEMAGTVGCNNFFATYKEHSPNINIRLLASTFLDCADGTKPKEFIDLLEAANSFAITQNELHLMDKENEIVFSFSNNHFKP